MRGKLLLLALCLGLFVGVGAWSRLAARQSALPGFAIANLRPLQGVNAWQVPQLRGLTVKTQRRTGNGPPGWLVEVFGAPERPLTYFYLLDGFTKWNSPTLWLAEVDGRPALVSWQPDLPEIDVFPSPEKIPRQVTFWFLGEQSVKRSAPYPRAVLERALEQAGSPEASPG